MSRRVNTPKNWPPPSFKGNTWLLTDRPQCFWDCGCFGALRASTGKGHPCFNEGRQRGDPSVLLVLLGRLSGKIHEVTPHMVVSG